MPINALTLEGLQLGMNQAMQPATIDARNYARTVQDILLDKPGLIRRRGPVKALTGSPTIAFKATGIALAQDYPGNYKLAVLAGDGSAAHVHLLNSAFTAVTTSYPWPGTFPNSPRYNAHSNPALHGGTLIGTSSGNRAVAGAQTNLGFWKGATTADRTESSHNTAITRGSATVTGTSTSWLSNLEAGMFVFDNAGKLAGTIASVDSNTQVTLEDLALITFSGTSAVFKSIRGLNPRVSTGLISCVTTSTSVTGANTAFSTQTLQTGTWDMYRAADLTYIGTVSSVTSDLVLVLTASAGVNMSKEPYLAIRRDADYAIDTNTSPDVVRRLGYLNSVYAGRQWYACRTRQSATNDYANRLWFSDTSDFESVHVHRGGDWFTVQSTGNASTPIVAIQGMANGLAIFKEGELWVVVGTDKSSFALRKVADLSLLDTGAVRPYSDGVIFAAKEGIFRFNGIQLVNLTAALGDNYHEALKTWTGNTDQAHAMIARDHFFVHLSNYTDPVGVTKGASNTKPTSRTIVVNLLSGALSYFTNLQIWGAVQMPLGSGLSSLYLVNTSGSVTSICDSQYLFNGAGTNDTITCDGLAAGPDFYWETARYDMGDGERKKLFKQIAMQYITTGTAGSDTLTMDTVPGLNETGTAVTAPWTQQSSFTNARIKFLKRSTHLGLRFYQTTSAVTDIQIGPYAIGFKWQRVGRI